MQAIVHSHACTRLGFFAISNLLGLVRMSACLGNVQTAWKALRQNQHYADLSFRHIMILCDSDSN